MLLDIITGSSLSINGGTARFWRDLEDVTLDEWIEHVDANLCKDQIDILRSFCSSLDCCSPLNASDSKIAIAAKSIKVAGFARGYGSNLPKLYKFKFGNASHHEYGDLLMLVDETPNHEDKAVLCATAPTNLVPIIFAAAVRFRGYDAGVHHRSVEVSNLMDDLLYRRD